MTDENQDETQARGRRRFVTGRRGGAAAFVVDEGAPGVQGSADERHRRVVVWGSDAVPAVPNDGTAPEVGDYFPGPGGWRMVLADVPPGFGVRPDDAVVASGDEALSTPGAFHTTVTVDLIVLVAGSLVVSLEGGESRVLHAGDSLVQNGLGHSWSNPFEQVATMATFLVGASPA